MRHPSQTLSALEVAGSSELPLEAAERPVGERLPWPSAALTLGGLSLLLWGGILAALAWLF